MVSLSSSHQTKYSLFSKHTQSICVWSSAKAYGCCYSHIKLFKSIPRQGILLLKTGGMGLVTYCDADWFGCSFTRRSRTGYLLLLCDAPISWKTKKQYVVSRSLAEAEYRAIAMSVVRSYGCGGFSRSLMHLPKDPHHCSVIVKLLDILQIIPCFMNV